MTAPAHPDAAPAAGRRRGPAGMPARVGRFELRRELGRGAHGAVWLAWDPQLEREVALKTLAGEGRDAGRLLREARAVGKLRHPNIVPVFEAGEHEGQPWLVFEYIEGRTLAQLLREEGPLTGARAAALMSGVLDALDEAHRQGIVHRDLKPSNVLVDAQNQPRVADFGIAGPVSRENGGDAAPLCGTAAYMAPEYIARREVAPQNDVFAAGLCLYELVTGRRAVEGDSLFQVLHRIANQDLPWPEEVATRVDERLRGVIAKACARDPAQRYASAAEMRQALDEYLMPLPESGAADGRPGGTLEFLLRRMRHKSDFPAMSSSISAITRMASSDGGDVNSLSNSILKDFALTNKILRIANSAYYRQFSSSGIATVSRAIVVLGFNTVRNIAMSLLFLDHLQNKPHAAQLREEFLRVSLGGMLARRLAQEAAGLEPEEALICAQFHRLGRLLTHYYFPEETEAIGRLVAAERCEEEAAAARVLGISYQDLGLGIARSWGFPETIVRSMHRVASGKVAAGKSREERLRALSGYANELCEAVSSGPADSAAGIARLRLRYGDCLRLDDRATAAALHSSIEDLGELSRIVRVDFAQTRIGRCLLGQQPAAPAAPEPSDPIAATAVQAAMSPPGEAAAAPAGTPPEPATEAVLANGIQDISDALLEERPLGQLLGIALEVIYRAMRFQRVLLCMRDLRSGSMCARFGFGVDAERKVPCFRFALADRQCIFNVALSRDVDVLISDAADPKIAPYVPEWHRRELGAQTFLLFPLRVKDSPVALIYADRETAGSIAVSPRELGLLRTLRNQVLLAIKQAA